MYVRVECVKNKIGFSVLAWMSAYDIVFFAIDFKHVGNNNSMPVCFQVG